MDDLIAALVIFRKYGNPESPTVCEHDVLWVNIDPALVTPEDVQRLKALGFLTPSSGDEAGFMSFKFGSC
jgi:hypothetical protein